jgi:hypothetical protein
MKIAIRSEREEKGMIALKVLGGLFAAAAALLVVREIPSLVRYARMESM